MKIIFAIEVQNGNVKFHASCDGRPLTRLESAHQLTKIASGLIRDGIQESGGRMIIPADSSVLDIRPQS